MYSRQRTRQLVEMELLEPALGKGVLDAQKPHEERTLRAKDAHELVFISGDIAVLLQHKGREILDRPQETRSARHQRAQRRFFAGLIKDSAHLLQGLDVAGRAILGQHEL